MAYGPKVFLLSLSHEGLQFLKPGRTVPNNIWIHRSNECIQKHINAKEDCGSRNMRGFFNFETWKDKNIYEHSGIKTWVYLSGPKVSELGSFIKLPIQTFKACVGRLVELETTAQRCTSQKPASSQQALHHEKKWDNCLTLPSIWVQSRKKETSTLILSHYTPTIPRAWWQQLQFTCHPKISSRY